MPVPLTTDQFEELVNKSGLIDPQRLQGHLQRCRASGTLLEAPAATSLPGNAFTARPGPSRN